MRELVIRRGPVFYEYKDRDANDSKFKTTRIPTYPRCEGLDCKWCKGMPGPGGLIEFPFSDKVFPDKSVRHIVRPPDACHLVAIEWCEFHPNQPIRIGWLLTSEEVEAGKKGIVWPENV